MAVGGAGGALGVALELGVEVGGVVEPEGVSEEVDSGVGDEVAPTGDGVAESEFVALAPAVGV